MDAKRKRRAALSKVAMPTQGLVTTSPSESPSTISRSSFSPSVFSQGDNQSFNEDIDSALASLDDLNDMERWANLVSHTSMADTPQQQYYQTEPYGLSPVRHRTINTLEVSTNLQTNVGYLTERDGSFDHLLGLRDGISDTGSRNSSGVVTTGGLSGLPEGTSGAMPNISSGRSGVPLSNQTRLPIAQGQVSTPIQQVLPTTSSLVHPGTSPRLLGGTYIPVQNISLVRLRTPELSTMALANAQQQSSTPVSQVLPTTSSLVPPAASLGLPVLQGLPREIVVTPSPVTSVLPAQQVNLASSLVVLSAVLAPGLQTIFSELQASNLASAMFKDVPQTASMAVQQFYGIFTAVLSAADWMSELCVMTLQGIQQVAMLSQSTLYNFAERFRQGKSGTNACASILSPSLSLGRPMALRV